MQENQLDSGLFDFVEKIWNRDRIDAKAWRCKQTGMYLSTYILRGRQFRTEPAVNLRLARDDFHSHYHKRIYR